MKRRGCLVVAGIGLALLAGPAYFVGGWYSAGENVRDKEFIVPDGANLSSLAKKLEAEGIVGSAEKFRVRARILGGSDPIRAGEFLIPAQASGADVLQIVQSNSALRRFVTIPEGMPSILVRERLMAEPLLTGEVDIPAEGSILPDSYAFERGESRAAVVARMQAAMKKALSEEWAKRSTSTVAKTPEEAMTLASIVEKETGKPSERPAVAGLYSNRVRIGMLLQADPTIIYPITGGKPLGRRIRQSEIQAINGYNTYTRVGLPVGPITNPGRESIAAVLNPAKTEAYYMVADGEGGHVFSKTLEEHNENVAKWFALRRQRGEM